MTMFFHHHHFAFAFAAHQLPIRLAFEPSGTKSLAVVFMISVLFSDFAGTWLLTDRIQ
jgi:hypothetical protein